MLKGNKKKLSIILRINGILMDCVSVCFASAAERGVEFYRTSLRRAIHAYYAERDFFGKLDNMADSAARWMVVGRLLEDFMKEKVECPELDECTLHLLLASGNLVNTPPHSSVYFVILLHGTFPKKLRAHIRNHRIKTNG